MTHAKAPFPAFTGRTGWNGAFSSTQQALAALSSMSNITRRRSCIAKALSAECRLLLLHWLREPNSHFHGRANQPANRRAVSAPDIAQKWNFSSSTATKHIGLLKAAGLVTVERHDRVKWVTRNAKGLAVAKAAGHLYIS